MWGLFFGRLQELSSTLFQGINFEIKSLHS
jgi:hypothetical protein